MYKYDNGQISIQDFGQPVGMNLKEDNRWVKKAMTIPWNAIEKRYAALFTSRKGNVAKSLRLGLGACIIQAESTPDCARQGEGSRRIWRQAGHQCGKRLDEVGGFIL